MTAVTVTIASETGAARHYLACCGEGDLPGAQAIVAAARAGGFLKQLSRQTPAALRRACAGGHLPLAQWVAVEFGLRPECAARVRCLLFTRACANGYYDTARWAAREFEMPADEAHDVLGGALLHARKTGQLAGILEVYQSEFGITLNVRQTEFGTTISAR